MSADDLATRAGIATLTVEGFESGRRQPRYKTLTALLRAFSRAGIAFDGRTPYSFRAGAEPLTETTA